MNLKEKQYLDSLNAIIVTQKAELEEINEEFEYSGYPQINKQMLEIIVEKIEQMEE